MQEQQDTKKDEDIAPDVNAEMLNDIDSAPKNSPALQNEDEDSGDPTEFIKTMLASKSTAKQTTFKIVTDAFAVLADESQRIINELHTEARPANEEVTLYYKSISKHEFHLKLAGDLLIFVMHTNVITFDDEHEAMKNPYIKENPVNRYFGQINIYNFMYDSIRYNRGNDPGYLIGRLMINHESRFFMEGEKSFITRYGQISREPISDHVLRDIVKHSLRIAIKNDLMAPPYARVRVITLYQKQEHTMEMGGGQKIGFQMSYQNRVES